MIEANKDQFANNPERPLTVKVTVNFYETDLERDKRIAKRRGTSNTAAMRSAFATEELILDTLDRGGRILLEEPDGSLKEPIEKNPPKLSETSS